MPRVTGFEHLSLRKSKQSDLQQHATKKAAAAAVTAVGAFQHLSLRRSKQGAAAAVTSVAACMGLQQRAAKLAAAAAVTAVGAFKHLSLRKCKSATTAVAAAQWLLASSCSSSSPANGEQQCL
jgi:hypothetical protein